MGEGFSEGGLMSGMGRTYRQVLQFDEPVGKGRQLMVLWFGVEMVEDDWAKFVV
jgi:hypothetical protein